MSIGAPTRRSLLSQIAGGGHASLAGVCLMSSTTSANVVTFTSITPNLLVRDVAKSTAFYRDVLGFEMGETVPDQEPFVFVWMKRNERFGIPERHQRRRP